MVNKIPLLSICIPTYNREKYLKECLDSIINQDGFNEDEIEIVISDNASIDNTKELVEKYQKKYTNMVYHRNNENIGARKNILSLPHHAHGEYIWYLSDDDMLSNIGLTTILKVIQEQKPGLILSQMYGFQNKKKINYKKINKKGNITTIIGINGFFDFLAKVDYDITPYMMLLSLFCFKKDVYIKNLNTIFKEYGQEYIDVLNKDHFPHSRIIFVPFGNIEKISVIEKDLILCRGGNISRSPSLVVCQDLLRLIKDLNKKYKINKITYRKMKKMYYFSVFSYIVITHIRKYIPKFLYNIFVYIGRNVIKLLYKIKSFTI